MDLFYYIKLFIPYVLIFGAGFLLSSGFFGITKKIAFGQGGIYRGGSAIQIGFLHLLGSLLILSYIGIKLSEHVNLFLGLIILACPLVFGQKIFNYQIKSYKEWNSAKKSSPVSWKLVIIGIGLALLPWVIGYTNLFK